MARRCSIMYIKAKPGIHGSADPNSLGDTNC
jgi:hypothetical protein